MQDAPTLSSNWSWECNFRFNIIAVCTCHYISGIAIGTCRVYLSAYVLIKQYLYWYYNNKVIQCQLNYRAFNCLQNGLHHYNPCTVRYCTLYCTELQPVLNLTVLYPVLHVPSHPHTHTYMQTDPHMYTHTYPHTYKHTSYYYGIPVTWWYTYGSSREQAGPAPTPEQSPQMQ